MIEQLIALLNAHLDAHQVNREDWPANAEYCVLYRCSTWPIGWAVELSGRPRRHVEFFQNKAALDAWIEKQREWSRLEDNYIAFQAYGWAWGPHVIEEVAQNTGNL